MNAKNVEIVIKIPMEKVYPSGIKYPSSVIEKAAKEVSGLPLVVETKEGFKTIGLLKRAGYSHDALYFDGVLDDIAIDKIIKLRKGVATSISFEIASL